VIVDLSKAPRVWDATPVAYAETIRTAEFRGGLYLLRAGATDPQGPHAEAEAYYVVRGRATFEIDGKRTPVAPGHAILVPAGVAHRFVDVEEDIRLFVLFALHPEAKGESA